MATESMVNGAKTDCDAWILAIAAHADRDCFARLFRHFAPRIKAYCMKRGSSPAAAEEVAQEAMIQVWRRAAQFDPAKASASAWIFTIARNKRIDMFRRESHPEIMPEDLHGEDSTAADSFDHIAQAETGDRLSIEIGNLPADQAEVIRKAFFEDKTHQVIAAELRLPLGTVKSRIRLALGRLRHSMPEFGS